MPSARSLVIQPISPDDKQQFVEAFERLSDRSRYRSRTVKITPSAPNETSMTDAPGSPSIRLNPVVARTSSSFASR